MKKMAAIQALMTFMVILVICIHVATLTNWIIMSVKQTDQYLFQMKIIWILFLSIACNKLVIMWAINLSNSIIVSTMAVISSGSKSSRIFIIGSTFHQNNDDLWKIHPNSDGKKLVSIMSYLEQIYHVHILYQHFYYYSREHISFL